MTYIMVDIESDGPIPGDYSMLSFGAVAVDSGDSFYAEIRPISDKYDPEALAVNSFTRSQSLSSDYPKEIMEKFERWLGKYNKPLFISDNNGFDWQFVNWYFHHFLGRNPFGYSSTNLGSLYKGLVKDTFKNFKHLRTTKHSHNALDDAIGNAEALIKMKQMGLKIKL